MKKGYLNIVGTILAATLLFTGCGQTSGQSSAASGSSTKILMCMSNGNDTFRSTLAEAAASTAQSLGVQFDLVDAQNKIETQVDQIRSAQTQGYDVILCLPVDVDTAVEMEASAGDLPIIFMNSCPADKRLKADKYMYVGSNEQVAGQLQTEYVLNKNSSKDELNVVIFKGEKSHSATKGRTEAVKNALKNSGKTINVVFEDYADWSTDKSAEMFNIFLSLNKPFDCVICNNDSMALGVIEACRQNGIDPASVPILGVDATTDGCNAIASGDMAFTVYQSATGQGEAAVKVALALAGNQSATTTGLDVSEDGKYVWVPFEAVDISNVTSYQ